MLIHVNNNKHRSWWPTLSRSATRISFANSRYLLPATKGPRIEIALEQIEDECAIGRDHNGRSVSDFVTIRIFYFLEKKKYIRCKRLRHDYAHLHTRYEEKKFSFRNGIRISFVINCPENGNLKRHNMNLGHVSHCYAILQNLSTLMTVEISR